MGDKHKQERNPEFNNLLQQMKYELASNGASIQLNEDPKEANRRLNATKLIYFENKIILVELKDILADGQKENSTSAVDEKAYLMLQDAIGNAEAKDHLRLSQVPGKEKCNIFGLSEDHLSLSPAKKRETQKVLQQYFTSEIELRLRKRCIDLIRFWDSKSEEESDGLSLAKATQLSSIIENEVKKISEDEQTLRDEKIENQKLVENYYEAICNAIENLEQSLKEHSLNMKMDEKKVTVNWLAAKCDAMQRKIRVLQCQLMKDTYNQETVSALRKIRNLLDTALKESKIELRKTRETLQVYESVGPGFESLVKQYVKLTAEIDNKKWALSELRRTKDSNETD